MALPILQYRNGLRPNPYCPEYFSPRARQGSVCLTWYWGRNSAMPWALSAYRNTQIAWYTQITAIRALTRRTSSSHCHPSHLPLWWHLVAVIARLGMPRNPSQKHHNISYNVGNYFKCNGARAAYKTIVEREALWASDHSWIANLCWYSAKITMLPLKWVKILTLRNKGPEMDASVSW